MTFDDSFTPLDQFECIVVDDIPNVIAALNDFSNRTDIGWSQQTSIEASLDSLEKVYNDLREVLSAMQKELDERTIDTE